VGLGVVPLCGCPFSIRIQFTEATLAFLVVNLLLGLLAILLTERVLTSAVLSVYRLDDSSLVFLYIIQDILF
jgi:hypothetical protein